MMQEGAYRFPGKNMNRQNAIAAVQKSRKFQYWALQPELICTDNGIVELEATKDFSPIELAQEWGVNVEIVSSIFRSEPGVLKFNKSQSKIPNNVAVQVHRKLSA